MAQATAEKEKAKTGPGTAVAPVAEGKPVAIVTQMVRSYIERRQMILPANYAVENALKSAWLLIQQAENRDHVPALQCCTQVSVQNALLSMVLQGLNPDKDQCYFIVYGKTLCLQRSYFGNIHLVKTLTGALDVFAEVVYKGDIFEYEITRGKKKVTKHVQKLENVNPSNIIAAYAIALYPDDIIETEIMTWDQIKMSWRKSIAKPFDDKGNLRPGTPHHDQTDQMCKRTVANRLCKPLINGSSDSALFKQYVVEAEEMMAEAEIDAEIEEKANKGEIIGALAEGRPEACSRCGQTEVPLSTTEGDKVCEACYTGAGGPATTEGQKKDECPI